MKATRRSPQAIRKRRLLATALVAAAGTVGSVIYNLIPSSSTPTSEPPVDEPSASSSPSPSATHRPTPKPTPLPSVTKTVVPKPGKTPLPTPSTVKSSTPPTPHPVAQSKVELLIAFLRSKVGHPYLWGGTGPSAYDCSGLVQAAYAHIGIHLPRTSEEQSLRGFEVSGTSQLQPGDILFWGAPGVAYHDGIYIGNGKYIAAENPERGIGVFTIDWWPPQYARRIL